jgi:hypothetical protein
MRIRRSIFAGVVMMLSALPGISATLTVQASVTPDAGLYDYTYRFSITGAGASVDNIFLGSNDLSPLNVVLKVDGNPAGNWSWLGNDIPQNYLQFFSTNGTGLGNGDFLGVTFSSQLAPQAAEFAVGLNGSTGDATNTATGVVGPAAIAAPEPGTLLLLLCGIALFAGARRYATGGKLSGPDAG